MSVKGSVSHSRRTLHVWKDVTQPQWPWTLVLVELALYFLGLHGSSLENEKKSLGAPLSLLVNQPCRQFLPGSGKFSLLCHLQSKGWRHL